MFSSYRSVAARLDAPHLLLFPTVKVTDCAIQFLTIPNANMTREIVATAPNQIGIDSAR